MKRVQKAMESSVNIIRLPSIFETDCRMLIICVTIFIIRIKFISYYNKLLDDIHTEHITQYDF